MVLNGKFAQPYGLLGSFLTKTNGFLTRLDNGWPIGRLFLGLAESLGRALDKNDRLVPTIVWKLLFNHIWVLDALNRPQIWC